MTMEAIIQELEPMSLEVHREVERVAVNSVKLPLDLVVLDSSLRSRTDEKAEAGVEAEVGREQMFKAQDELRTPT